jgi:O-antigen/teichoic acid export membrane protein
MSMNRKLFSGALGGLTFASANMAVSFLQFSILVRRLPLEIVGIWIIFANFATYVMFLDMGMTPTLGREISFAAANPEFSETARAERIGTLIRSCTTVVGVLAPFVFLIGAGGGWSYLRTIVPSALAPQARAAWFVFVAGAAVNLVGEGWFAGIYGLGQVFREKIIRSVAALLGLLFLVIAIFSGSGFMGLAIAYLLQSICSVLMARFVLSRVTSHAIGKGTFDFRIVRELVGPSLKYAATFLGAILILQTDNIVIASTLGPKLVPNYQAVAKMITILMGLSMMLVMTSVPLASQAYARNDAPAMLRLLNRNLRFCLSVMVILGSFLACFADRVISVWLGPSHFVGFPVVWVLLIVMVLEAHHQAMGAATMSTGRIVFLVPALTAGVVNIFFSIILARRYGLIGVVFGTMIAQVMTNNWYVPWYTMRLFKISFISHARAVLVPLLCLIAVMLTTGTSVRFMTGHLSNILSVTVGSVCTVIVGILCFSGIMVTPQERGTLLARLRARGLSWTALPSSDVPL